MRRLPLFLGLMLLGCAPVHTSPSTIEGVHFSAARETPRTVRLLLDNGTREPIGYNLCHSQLQRLDGTTWTSVQTGEVCTMELRTLHPGFDATFDKTLPASLQGGEYRFITNVESPVGASPRGVTSHSFRVPS